jgi:hypothetical protein
MAMAEVEHSDHWLDRQIKSLDDPTLIDTVGEALLVIERYPNSISIVGGCGWITRWVVHPSGEIIFSSLHQNYMQDMDQIRNFGFQIQ